MSRWRNPRLWIGVASTALVLVLAIGSLGRTSPGALAAPHAALNGAGKCADCHGGFFGEMTESCLECHKPIAQQMKARSGLHGIMEPAEANRCAVCHSDHHGDAFQMVNDQSFMAAGADRETFDHKKIRFAMDGKHLELDCTECHKNADIDVLPEGERRFLGLDKDCASCHEDPHEGKMVFSCVECHSQKSWEELGSDGHDKFLPLIGGHADMSCRACHADDSDHALEKLGHVRANPRQCMDCHESPHSKPFVATTASMAALAEPASCVVCHKFEHETFRDERLTVTVDQHGGSDFPLAIPHHDVTCAECHKPELETFVERYPGRQADDCIACHEDVHLSQFLESPLAPNGCVDCHSRTEFTPHTFTVRSHKSAGLPLEGAHVKTDCNDCHVEPKRNEARLFRGLNSDCASCHRDVHRGAFDHHDKEAAGKEHGLCSVCHKSTTFRDLLGTFDHGKWTTFAIAGAHAQASCETCHPRGELPDANGRTLGRVSDHFGKYTGCVTCHKDPHDKQFDKKDLPQSVNGKEGCARCHIETSFRSFPDGFEHGTWTGFLLEGAHARTDCASCHKPRRRPDKTGRTWNRAKGNRCADCHSDPHAGQFEKRKNNDCESCHRSASSFADLTFRHNFDSRFRLDKTHGALDCAECHKKERINGKVAVRYRPLGTTCADCHGSHNNPLRRRKRSGR